MLDLAVYAVSARSSRGRRVEEAAPDGRTEFQRDRDRIIHSTAFRRLEYKTQVFRYDDWPFTADGYNITEAYERLKLPILEHVGQGEMHDNNPFTGATDVYEPGQPGERP